MRQQTKTSSFKKVPNPSGKPINPRIEARQNVLVPIEGKTDQEILDWYFREMKLADMGYRIMRTKYKTMPHEEALDVAAEACVRLMKGWANHRTKGNASLTIQYFVRLVNFTAVDLFRNKTRRAKGVSVYPEVELFPSEKNGYELSMHFESVYESASFDPSERQLGSLEHEELYQQALTALDKTHRKFYDPERFLRALVDGESTSELAEELGLNRKTVISRIGRIAKSLKKFGKELPTDQIYA